MLFATCSRQALGLGAVQSIRHGKTHANVVNVQNERISAEMVKLLALVFVVQVHGYFPSQLLSLLERNIE